MESILVCLHSSPQATFLLRALELLLARDVPPVNKSRDLCYHKEQKNPTKVEILLILTE